MCVVLVPLPWSKPNLMVHYHASGTHTKHGALPDSNSLHCMTLNIRYPHPDYGILSCINLLCVGWISVCGTIAMAQTHCNGSLLSF